MLAERLRNMEIDCPPYAIAIWLEGDEIAIRFPDRQRVNIPVNVTMLVNILKPRCDAALACSRDHMRPGTNAAPVQYDIDKIADVVRSGRPAPTIEQIKERRERERNRLLRASAKRDRLKEANELLAIAGL